jgi:hypothetical protein
MEDNKNSSSLNRGNGGDGAVAPRVPRRASGVSGNRGHTMRSQSFKRTARGTAVESAPAGPAVAARNTASSEEAVTTQPVEVQPLTPTSSMMPTSTRTFLVDQDDSAAAGTAPAGTVGDGVTMNFDVASQQQLHRNLLKPSTEDSPDAAAAAAKDDPSNNIFQKRDDYYNVDQSVNLMDSDAATYESKNKRKAKRSSGMANSFLADPSQQQHPHQRERASGTSSNPSWWFHPQRQAHWNNMTMMEKLRDIFGRLLIPMGTLMLIALVLLTVVIVDRNSYEDKPEHSGTKPPTDIIEAPQGTNAPEATAVEPTSDMEVMQTILLELDVTKEKHFQDTNSPAYKALGWLAEDEIAKTALGGSAGRRKNQRRLVGAGGPKDRSLDDTTNTDRLVQRYVLAVLYYALQPHQEKGSSSHEDVKELEAHLKGPWWTDGLWMTANNECEWQGVACHDLGKHDDDGMNLRDRIHMLNLTGYNMEGTLPVRELQSLRHLDSLDLRHNYLQGDMADFGEKMANWISMKHLLLVNNTITGTLPENLGVMENLTSLDLSFNKLTGTLPTQSIALTKLKILRLRYNQLEGTIPESFLKQMTNLVTLNLNENKLTGELPSDLSHLSLLHEFKAGNNTLKGSIPSSLANLHQLSKCKT